MIKENKRAIIFHDLILIHRERLSAYEQLVKWTKDVQLSNYLYTLTEECRNYMVQLHGYMKTDLGDPASHQHVTGIAYQQWRGIKPILPGCSEQDIITACRENEKALSDIYKNLLRMRGIFTTKSKKLLALHFTALHKTVSLLRNFNGQPATPSIRKNFRTNMGLRRGLVIE